MKTGYFKEILKTTAKVALIAGVTAVAAPYAFGFAVGFFNLMAAGYVAGAAVTAIGAVSAVKTLVKDVTTMRERVKKQQREEYVDEKLEELNKNIKRMQPNRLQPSMTRLYTNQKDTKTAVQGKKKKIPNLIFWKKGKQLDRAA